MTSAFEKVTRNMVDNLKESVDKGFKGIGERLTCIENKQVELFNHQSNRLPPWVTILFTIGGSLITGLIVWAVAR